MRRRVGNASLLNAMVDGFVCFSGIWRCGRNLYERDSERITKDGK